MDKPRRAINSLAFLAVAVLAAISATTAKADEQTVLCKLESLPTEVQHRLKADFVSWKIQEVSDLSASAKPNWLSWKPLGCPGIAIGRFENTARLSYAHDFFNQGWIRKSRLTTGEGIIFSDSGVKEYESDVYYWADGRFKHEWVDR